MQELDELKIIYIDEDIALVEKLPGQDSQSLPELLKAAEGGEGYCVHRLDKAVGGLLCIARNSKAAARMSAFLAEGRVDKEYLAVLPSPPSDSNGRLEDLLFHDKAKNKTFVVKRQRKGVKPAALEYELLESRDGMALVKVHLITGRSHQIRVQFASRKLPLLGDVKYGSQERRCNISLWAYKLSLPHPSSAEAISMELCPPESWPWSEFSTLKTQ